MNFLRLIIIIISSTVLSILSILLTPLNLYRGIGTFYVYRTFSKIILFVSGVKLNVKINPNIDKNKEYIIVSNHLSYLDIPILMRALPLNIRFIYKKSLSKIPFFGWSLFLGGYIPIDRKNARNALESLKKAARRVKDGISIAIFPEGTRSETGITADFKKGIFMLAEYANVEIVPVTIINSNNILRKNSFKIYPGFVKVIIDNPIRFNKEKNLLKDIRSQIISNIENEKPFNIKNE